MKKVFFCPHVIHPSILHGVCWFTLATLMMGLLVGAGCTDGAVGSPLWLPLLQQ
jgi:hypothetical protein